MKCYQCPSPAMYLVEDEKIPLCLDCFYKFSQIKQQEIENNERQINFISDEMDYAVGLPRSGPRFPARPKLTFIQGVKLNNISVNNSTVGTINTGSIGTVDQSISALVTTGQPEVAHAMKAISEAVLQSADLTNNQKNEIIDILSIVAKEASTPEDSRKNSVALTLIEKAEKTTSIASDITDVCQKWWPVLAAIFKSIVG